LALRTTVLVGYPGEQDSHFEHLLNFMEEVQFDRLGGFAYSDEEGTFAFDQLKQPKIDTEVVQERLDTLMALQQQISYDLNQKKVGQVLTTLVDNTAAEGENFEYIGRSEYDAYEVDQNVLITGQTSPGCFEQVRITKAHEFDLEGVVVS
jgi:ribosomal protein S12 methylthiotransferase